MKENGLIVFVKNPKLGKVKTRIAAQTSDEKALSIYGELLDHTRQISLETNVNRILYYSSFINNEDEWSNEAFDKKVQEGDGLGVKMYHAINQEIQNYKKVVLVGSDIGALTSDIIDEAFEALNSHDVVIGPAIDGGYYLVGMKGDYNIFDDIEWSTPFVLKQTTEKINNLQLSYALMPVLSDIDYIEDYIAWKSSDE